MAAFRHTACRQHATRTFIRSGGVAKTFTRSFVWRLISIVTARFCTQLARSLLGWQGLPTPSPFSSSFLDSSSSKGNRQMNFRIWPHARQQTAIFSVLEGTGLVVAENAHDTRPLLKTQNDTYIREGARGCNLLEEGHPGSWLLR